MLDCPRQIRLSPSPLRGGRRAVVVLRRRRRARRPAWRATWIHTGPTTPRPRASRPTTCSRTHGYRDPRVIVLSPGRPTSPAPQTKPRVEAIERASPGPRRRRVASRATTTPARRDFVSRDGDATYLAVALRPTDDKARQDAASSIADQLERQARASRVGGCALAQEQVNKQVESDLRTRRAARVPAPVPALAAVLPQPRRRAAAAADRRPGDRRHLLDPEDRQRVRLDLDLRPQPDHRARARPGDRLQPVHRLPLPRGDRQAGSTRLARGRTERWEALRATMGTAGRTVLFSSLTVAAALASLIVFPQRFLYSMGIGGSLVALIAAGRRAGRPAGDPQHPRPAGQRARAALPAAARRARRDRRPSRASGTGSRASSCGGRSRSPTISAALLIALGIPFFSIKFTSVDAQVLPASASARQVDDVMRADFPPFRDTPIRLAVQGGGRGEVTHLVSEVERESRESPRSAARGGSAAG